MNNKFQEIKNYWEGMAKEFKGSQLATAPDTYYRQFEIAQIEEYLQNGKAVLDIGCGNGFSMLHFTQTFPKARFLGIDYSPLMIKYAKQNLGEKPKLKKRVSFEIGDVLKLSELPLFGGKKFDFIVSERCLINLLDWPQQKQALLQMKKLLKKNGKIILCENTQEGLGRLNQLRKKFGLPAIKTRWHNFYVPERQFLPFARRHFRLLEAKNIGSLYYIISRVVYAKLADLEKKEPDYLHPINKIASQLPPIGNHSPNFIFLLQQK